MGEKMVMPFDILWTTDDPNAVNTAREYLQSTAAVDGLNSGVVNVYQSKYRHLILPRVATTAVGAPDSTKRGYWGLASSQYTTAYLGIWEEPHLKTPSDLNAGEDFSTDKNQLSALWETIRETSCKFRETLIETILSETQRWGRATTIISNLTANA